MDTWKGWLEYEGGFDAQMWIDFHREHGDIPVVAVSIYLVIIFYGAELVKKPIPCRRMFALWNLLLCVFSVIGASRCLPVLLSSLNNHGFVYTVCTDPAQWYLKGGVGLWTGLFIYSKIPELMDTVFLVVQKKNVIFLHWFHHLTVLLYCWHAFHFSVAPGLWFATMNYCVHAIMYCYYFMCIVGLSKIARPIAPLITSLQVLQMIGGIAVTAVSAYQHHNFGPTACSVNASNYRLGLMMYSVYLVLFLILFSKLYLSGNSKHRGLGNKKKEVANQAKEEECLACLPGCVPAAGEPDKAGLFFFQTTENKKENKSD